MFINNKCFRNELREKVIELLNSRRGVQSELAKSVNKKSSYFSEMKRGNPVNALHLKAIGLVFGGDTVLNLLGINNISSVFKDQPRANRIIQQLVHLEQADLTKYSKAEGYIDALTDTTPAATGPENAN